MVLFVKLNLLRVIVMPKKISKVYMTYLGTEDYLIGVLALNASLKKMNSRYPLYVLLNKKIVSNVKSKLIRENINIIEINKDFTIPSKIVKNNCKLGYEQWNNTFQKLYIFGMTRFDKIVFLDSDLFIKQNIDELFNENNLAAVVAGKSYPGNEKWKELNSGVMVITPRTNEDKKLLSLIGSISNKEGLGDQDIIQAAYPSWSDQKLELDECYNVLSGYEAYYIDNICPYKKIKIVHYAGHIKPWNMTYSEKFRFVMSIIKKSIITRTSMKSFYLTIKDLKTYLHLCRKVRTTNEFDS